MLMMGFRKWDVRDEEFRYNAPMRSPQFGQFTCWKYLLRLGYEDATTP